jgi:hypothetical protein
VAGFHDMTDAQIDELARRAVEIVRASKGRTWVEDVRHATREVLRGSRRASNAVKAEMTLERRVARLESIVLANALADAEGGEG